jgi:carboxyl-terminal processing protease
MSSRTRFIVFMVTAPIVVFTLVGGVLSSAVAREDTYRHLRVFEDVVSLITDNYVEEVDLGTVMSGALRGLAEGLDADSSHLTASQVQWQETRNRPDAQLGLEVTRQFYVQVVAARDGSPAAKAGLVPGDFIRAIDDEPTRLMSAFEGAQRLRGEAGSTVRLSVLRGNSAEAHELTLVRERTSLPAVTTRLLPNGVGHVRIAEFTTDVPDRLKTAVSDLQQQGATRLALDVRSTAFGTFDAGVNAARLFVGTGTLVVREESGDARQPIDAGGGDGALTLPTVVLVNAGTSGPAELFAAALADAKRTRTIGQRTAGRAGEQKMVKLPDGSALWLTWAKYVTASGTAIHRNGIEPAVPVDEPLPDLGEPLPTDDPILDRALAELAGL